jgi:hypothetical protein
MPDDVPAAAAGPHRAGGTLPPREDLDARGLEPSTGSTAAGPHPGDPGLIRLALPRDPDRRDRLIVAAVYTLAWGALLVNRGLYWDDWTLVGRTTSSILQQFDELGMPWVGVLDAALVAFPLAGLVGHVVTFVAYLLSSLAVHAIVRRIPGASRTDALIGAAVFAVFPVNYARVALIDISYALSLLAFLAATWLLVRNVEGPGRASRVAALVLFVGSFSTASFLVLYVVPIALAAVLLWRRGRRDVGTIARHADFLLLPVVFWVAKTIWFTPHGVYVGYNALTGRGLANVPRLMLGIPNDVIVEPLSRAVGAAGVAGLVVGVAAAVWLVRRSGREVGGHPAVGPALIALGAIVIALGVFPYLAVGRIPTIWDWSSRHQLLVPIGAAVIVVGIARLARQAGAARPAILFAVGLAVGVWLVADARTLVVYQRDWFKQVALREEIGAIPEVRAAHHVRVVDEARSLDALRRTYRFYEYNALFSEALGDTTRLFAGRDSEPAPDALQAEIARPAYHMTGYVPGPVDLELRVRPGEARGGPLDMLRLVMLEATGSSSFGPEAARLIDVTAGPPTAGDAAP